MYRKSQNCPFCLKIDKQSISGMLILLPTLVFSISNTESIFGYFWAEKVKCACLPVNRHTHTHARTHKYTHTHAHTHTHTYTHTHTHTYTHAQTLSQGCYVYSEIRLVSRKLDSPLCLEAFTQTVDVIVRSHWNVWKQR